LGTGAGQIGLTILRSRIDPSSTTGGSNWATELQNAQQAQKINSQVIVFATPWTPPAVWKSNGSVDDGTLNTSDYDNFANYLNEFIAYEKAGGVNLYAISVQNEPDFLPDYESCGYTGAQMDAWIAQEGGKINTKLMMPESDSFNLDESDPTLDDSNAVGFVSIVAGHTYGVNPVLLHQCQESWQRCVDDRNHLYAGGRILRPADYQRCHLGSRALSPVDGCGAVQRLCLLVDASVVERK
jgi:glucuronoarabinoxylan endo-1,4-beta-xylanase